MIADPPPGRPAEPPAEEWHVPPRAVAVDPLLSCLVLAAGRLGRDTSEDALGAGLPRSGDRLAPDQLGTAAARAGLTARLARMSPTAIPARLLPAIVLLSGRRACLLTERLRDGRLRIVEPAAPEAVIDVAADELSAECTGIVCILKPRHRFDARTPEIGRVPERHWFWGVVLSNAPLYRDAMAASLLLNLFGLALPLYSMNVYDRVVPNHAVETLWVLSIGVILVLAFDFALRTLRASIVDTAAKRVDVLLSADIMRRVLGLRMTAKPLSVGAFAANLRAFESVRDFIASATVTSLIDVPFVLLFLAALAWISPALIVPPLIALTGGIAGAWAIQARMQALVESSYRATAQRNGILVESLVGLEAVKAAVAEGDMQAKWEESTRFIARVGARIRLLTAITVNFSLFLQQSVTVAVVVTGVYLLSDKAMTLGGIIAASMLAGRAMAPLGAAASLLLQYWNARTSLETLDRQMNLPVERDGSAFVKRGGIQGAVEFRHVSFAYADDGPQVLQEVSFKLAPGERVAIVGRIGSGKSTIEKLILGLYQPTRGSVLIDGVDLRQVDPAELRRSIGFVPQEAVLFFGSLRSNIALGSPAAADADILAAARLAGVAEFADAHPHGYDMQIGERGESLSGGQRQAVSIARALLEHPPLLLFDEPTSAMDHQSEEAFKQRLREFLPGRTLLLVTHRASLLDLVDRLVVVDAGRIVADGPKSEVLEALQQGRVGRAA
jgi:ATP-binding cassette, subfamily C, bacterial LapB